MGTSVVTSASKQGVQDADSVFADMKSRLKGPPQLLVVFASVLCPLSEVMQAAQKHFPKVPSVGSSTAGEFSDSSASKNQFVALLVGGDDVVAATGMGTQLKLNAEAAVEAALPQMPEDSSRPHLTAILLVDPLSGKGEETALIASTLLGPTVRLAGGAAGDELKFKQTQVACGTRVESDAVVLALIASKKPLGIGVQHGHTPLSPPLTVTKASGARVQELDGKPAFEVWKNHVRASAAKRGVNLDAVPLQDMGSHLLRYEVGLIAGANEYKIRAPLAVVENGALEFACGLPEGAVVRVTESVEEAQIASAKGAAMRARKALGRSPVAGALVFDCICRSLILGGAFSKALKEIHEALGSVPMAGFETYGEIAMDLGQSSGFHNTTTVVLAFPE